MTIAPSVLPPVSLPLLPDADDWRWQLRNRISTKDEIAARLPLTPEEVEGLDAAPGHFRVAVTPYYFSLIDAARPDCPVRMQVIPRGRELVNEPGDLVDPLGEDSHSPATGSSTVTRIAVSCSRSTAAPFTAATATAGGSWGRARRPCRATISPRRSTTSGARPPSATC